MGVMIDGEWQADGEDGSRPATGEFRRPETQFRRWIRADPGAEFPAAAGRYHLYLALACPWCHRALLFRLLKRLEGASP